MAGCSVHLHLILFSIAWKSWGGQQHPVAFYRSTALNPTVARTTTQHERNEKFVYLSNGRGFETEQDGMQHLIVSLPREVEADRRLPEEEVGTVVNWDGYGDTLLSHTRRRET